MISVTTEKNSAEQLCQVVLLQTMNCCDSYSWRRRLLPSHPRIITAFCQNQKMLSVTAVTCNREFIVQLSNHFCMKVPGELTKLLKRHSDGIEDWPYDRRIENEQVKPCEPVASGIIIWINLNKFEYFTPLFFFFCFLLLSKNKSYQWISTLHSILISFEISIDKRDFRAFWRASNSTRTQPTVRQHVEGKWRPLFFNCWPT